MPGRESVREERVVVCVVSVADASCLVAAPAVGPASSSAAEYSAPILNPADQAAVKFASALAGGARPSVLAVHVGPPGDEDALREALAHGAADALLLETPVGERLDAPRVVEAIVELCAASGPDWIFCGQATLDWGNGLVGPTIAGLLGWPVIDHVVEVHADGDSAVRCQRVIGRGIRDEIRLSVPAVIAASPLAFQPVIPPLRDRLRAQRAAIETRPAGGGATLPRPARRDIARPRPRPKAMLPPSYSEWSPEDRLAFLTQSGPSATTEPTQWLRGDAATVASQVLDFVESSGVHLPWAR